VAFVIACVALIVMGLSRAGVDQVGDAAPPTQELVNADAAGVEPRPVDPATPTEDGHEATPLIETGPKPDVVEAAPFRPEFAEALMRAAQTDFEDPARCGMFIDLLGTTVASASTPEEWDVAVSNVADACTRGAAKRALSEGELALAHEAVSRGMLDASENDAETYRAFLRTEPDLGAARFALAWIDVHDPGTQVLIDGKQRGTEPCAVAVPVDGRAHEVSFRAEDGGDVATKWAPATPDEATPEWPPAP
jgi:hypothetical protein